MHPTHNDLLESTRQKVIPFLQVRLSEALDLYTHFKQAHWTLKAPTFIALHELFDKMADNALEAADLIAERIEQLGGQAIGTAKEVAKTSLLPTFDTTQTKAEKHLTSLIASLGHFAKATRSNVDEAAHAGDAITADLLTEIMRTVDKNLWFLESHKAL